MTAAAGPGLFVLAPRRPRAAVLVAHGGRADSFEPAGPWRAPALRMYPFLLDLARCGRSRGLAVCGLRYRVAGFNDGDPVRDVDWAIAEVARRYGDVPVALVGHSMGGRAVLRAAGAATVRGVCALAPWLPPGEPVSQLAGREVLIAHGDRDRVTDPRGSLAYAHKAQSIAARLVRFRIARAGHGMLERVAVWQRLAREFTLATVGLEPFGGELAAAFGLVPATALEVVL